MGELTRRDLLAGIGAAAMPRFRGESDLEFLRKLVLSTLEGSRVAPGSNGPKGWPIKNTCGFPLVTPGRLGYPAFWIRDFSMAADSGLMPTKEIEDHLFLIAKCQSGIEERHLKSGGILRPFSIPDHIDFDGKPVYYPGTYSSGEDQGGEPWGTYPPADDHFEFIHIAWLLAGQSKSKEFLARPIGDMTLSGRLEKAFFAPTYDYKTGLIETTAELRAVGFGFCDSITVTGKLLYPSLLRWRAAKELAELTGSTKYLDIAGSIQNHLWKTFIGDKQTQFWLYASTGIGSGQPDVWGCLLAIHLGILPYVLEEGVRDTVVKAYKRGEISLDAAVRHVPTDRDFSKTSAWEKALEPKGIYQNGAYWHTPTGWLIEALFRYDKNLGRQAFQDYIAHLRKGGDVPWECFNPALNHYQNGGYLASVALPYSVLKGIKQLN